MAECGAQARKSRPGGFGRLAWYILQGEASRSCTYSTIRKGAATKLKHQRTNVTLQKKIKAMKNRSPTPPVHVHVDESTPVHVYVKKSQKPAPPRVQCHTSKSKMKGDAGSLRRSAKVKTKAPWVPPGKTSNLQKDYKWEGATHRLEITPPEPDKMFSTLHLHDLSTDEEEQVHGKMNDYEKKIESLMTEMGTLKTEVESQRKGQSQAQLSKSKELLEAQKEELDDMCREFCQAETANKCLRRSIDRIKEEKCQSLMEKQQQEREDLLSKLVEAEMDGSSAATQASLLKASICRLRNEKHMTCSDINLVTRQKEQLLEKLDTFDETNRSLRQLLMEQHCREEEIQRLMEQKDMLLKRLSDSDTEKTHLQLKLCEREREMEDLLSQLHCEKDLTRTASDVSKSLECTKAHLQGQLKNREAENNRLRTQIRNLESSEAQQKAELCKLLDELQELKQRADKEKDALKKATRLQKQRAERCEGTVEQLTCQLKGKDAQLDEALSAIETWRSRVNKLLSEKSQLEEDITCLHTRIQELVDERQCIEENAHVERESLMDKLHRQTQDNAYIKLENEKLKATTCTVEEKLNRAYGEVQQLKASLRQYESLVESYKGQVQKTRLEADEICLKLELCDKENKLQREDMNREMEALRRKFNGRLAELEQLPEMLKNTESKLQECQEQLVGYEKKNRELSSIISELRVRMEEQGDKMESTRERFQSAMEENKQLIQKLEELERKLEEAGAQNKDLVQIVAKREESIHQNQVRLEDKTRECASLARQLEAAIQDARRQVEQTRERASSKERTTTTKVLDLETQLSRTKTELNQLRRSKEDAERRFQSRLQDLKDRLEQSESTNRSMQNYVQFLKSSYANVFGDTTLSSSPVRPRTPL